MRRLITLIFIFAALGGAPRPALAGMPAVGFSEIASLRIEAISFFLLALGLVSAVVQWIWNWLRADFAWLPRLSYPKALGLMTVWGLLFVVVLTMISGARELMTPGAWKRDGLTYRLNDEGQPKISEPTVTNDSERRTQIERLAELLTLFAREHNGAYPQADEIEAIPVERWLVPGLGTLRYVYRPGLTSGDGESLLAYEPLVDDGNYFAITARGELLSLTAKEIERRVAQQAQP